MNETTDATAIFAPLWRRKWLILAVGIIVGAATYVHYKKEPQVFAEKTQLYLGAAAEGQALLNNTLGKNTISQTALANQAQLIDTTISEQVHKKFHREHNGVAAKVKVKAKAAASSDFIQLSGEGHTPKAVAESLNAYAAAYISHRQSNYEHNVRTAIETTRKQIKRIEKAELAGKGKSKGGGGSANVGTLQTAALGTKLNQLEADLTITGVEQIGKARPAKAELIGPAPKKNGIFGFVIGIVLATLAVYVLSRFNRRVRSLTDIETIFKAPVLAAAPAVRTPIVRSEGRVRPSRHLAEPLRRLNTSLSLSGLGGNNGAGGPRSILFLSAEPGDGKSVFAAGLALVQRDAGKRTALVEADFRRPVLGRLLGVGDGHGLLDVLSGALGYEAALQEVPSVRPTKPEAPEQPAAAGGVATAVRTPELGTLALLMGARGVPDPPALIGRPEMREVLGGLRQGYDHVIVDAPSPMQVSDVMPLLGAVDGIVIVARVAHTRMSAAMRLMTLLQGTPSAPVLGVVANAVPKADMRRAGFSSEFGERGGLLGLLRR